MIIAELNGKIPSKLQDKEDLLTSNVFSFFKYSDRIFLKEYLCQLGIDVSLTDSKSAEFIFWSKYKDRTEPDLIIVCGVKYILFEAKLYSDFSPKTSTTDSQISREIKMGKLSSENADKEFVYVAITAEYYKDETKYSKYENNDFQFIWTNWQTIANFIEKKLTAYNIKKDNEFASDLYSLLVKKRLRSFIGIANIKQQYNYEYVESVYYNLKSSKFLGDFSGFIGNLLKFQKIKPYSRIFIKSFFNNINTYNYYSNKNIFYNGKKSR